MKPSESEAWHAIDGWCTPEEADALYSAAIDLPDGAVIVEIGTWKGKSAIALGMSGKHVTTIEYNENRDRNLAVRTNANRCEVHIAPIIGESRALAEMWHIPIDMLYIDGWHDAENVRSDYAAWAPHVIPGGAIWFHDAYGAGWPDVQALIDELVQSGALTLEGYTGTIARCRKVGA